MTTAGTRFQDAPNLSVKASDASYTYRELGPRGDVPIVFLVHLAAVQDNWDPRIVDGIAQQRHVITLNYRGTGGSTGKPRASIEEMAQDAVDAIHALGYDKVDVHGFSLGGMVAQEILGIEPGLVRKLILTGTGPAGGVGIDKVTGISIRDSLRGVLTLKDPKVYLFFTRTENGKQAASAFIKRINERTKDRDKKISVGAFRAQLKAIHAWGLKKPIDLSKFDHPVLVANGEDDRMVPTSNSEDMASRFPNSELRIYPDAGHGGVFQFHDEFVAQALEFLQA
ncbi:alpha/beta hydrolase [Nocardioides marmoriginsengisoli]|uniref:Alpha/beta hydrolase n=1 Tax=Nocardioides marmoriginsengisoli TaxID=661483 RepID=A0A3N0CHH8_9ACTN|nr:alpha/beta hydrolase [Nocardioides marmoriginsengisoli]RNL62739.1 alpha/beta hydrolase [Nocardioides marmoriginsengisoli]